VAILVGRRAGGLLTADILIGAAADGVSSPVGLTSPVW
jgi:hypothetical protein